MVIQLQKKWNVAFAYTILCSYFDLHNLWTKLGISEREKTDLDLITLQEL